MAFLPGGMRLCPWSVLRSGGLTMRSDRHHPPAPGGIRRGRSSRALCGTAAWRGKALAGSRRCLCRQRQPRTSPDVYQQRVLGEMRGLSIISKYSAGEGRRLAWEAQSQGDAWDAAWQHALT